MTATNKNGPPECRGLRRAQVVGTDPPTATPPSSPRLGVVVGATRPLGQVLPQTLAERDVPATP